MCRTVTHSSKVGPSFAQTLPFFSSSLLFLCRSFTSFLPSTYHSIYISLNQSIYLSTYFSISLFSSLSTPYAIKIFASTITYFLFFLVMWLWSHHLTLESPVSRLLWGNNLSKDFYAIKHKHVWLQVSTVSHRVILTVNFNIEFAVVILVHYHLIVTHLF